MAGTFGGRLYTDDCAVGAGSTLKHKTENCSQLLYFLKHKAPAILLSLLMSVESSNKEQLLKEATATATASN